MTEQATDFLKDYQALAQQSWEAWMRYLQQAPGTASPFAAPPPQARQDDLLHRSMAGAKAYADWLRSAAGSGLGQGGGDWQQQMQNLFAGMGGQPFTQAFAGLDSAAAQSFFQQWQQWLGAQPNIGAMPGFGAMPGMASMPGMNAMPGFGNPAAFGYTREKQLQQQALANAMREYADMASRYQGLIQRANAQGFEQLQARLADMAQAEQHIESLKALYDLWVDAAEDCYSKIALSEEFQEVYGAMVNAQMRVRQLQQQQLEATCRELGLPTRSEVTALGRRLQELRREMRAQAQPSSPEGEADVLRAEVAELKRKLAAAQKQTSTTKTAKAKPADKSAPARVAGRSISSKRVAGAAKPGKRR